MIRWLAAFGKVKKMRKFSNKRIGVYIGILALLVFGMSYAYWSSALSHENVLEADTLTGTIEEEFKSNSQPEGKVTKEVSFRNTGSSAAFLRIAYSESWERDVDGEKVLMSNTVNGIEIADKKWTEDYSASWIKGDDGWLYYNKLLEPGQSTRPILQEVVFPKKYTGALAAYGKADYNLYFRMELLQASDSASTLNSSDVNRRASLEVFGKEAVLDSSGKVLWK